MTRWRLGSWGLSRDCTSAFTRPPKSAEDPSPRSWSAAGQRYGCARIDLRTVLATHVSFQFVDRHRLRPAHDVQRDRLVSVITEAPDLKIPVAGVQRVTERRRGLRGPLVA